MVLSDELLKTKRLLESVVADLEDNRDGVDLKHVNPEEYSYMAGFRDGLSRAIVVLNCYVSKLEGGDK